MGELKSLVSCPFGDDGEELFSAVDVSSCNYRKKKARNGQMKNSMFSSSSCCVTQWFWNECRATEKKKWCLRALAISQIWPARPVQSEFRQSRSCQFPNCMHYSDEIFIKNRENC